MVRRKAFLQIAILAALVAITIAGTAHGAFAACTDCCDEGYTGDYRCEGRQRQRLWQYSDCTREWRTVETCPYDCDDDRCSRCDVPRIEVSPSIPSDRFEGETAYTTIKVRNFDDRGDWFNFGVYLCEAGDICRTSCGSCDSGCSYDCDYDDCNHGWDHDCNHDCDHSCDDTDRFTRNCREMSCDDTHIYVPGDGRKYIKCSKILKDDGDYRIKVVYWNDDYDDRRTVYSGVFEVRDEDCEGEGVTGDYRCFGKYRQQKHIDEDCDVRWKIVEYCPYGCESAACAKPAVLPKLGEPEIFMRTQYEMEECKLSSFTFTVRNEGESDIFSIDAGGDVASWIDVAPSVTIGRGETKVITAYASVPCDATAGAHEFTITSSSKTTDTRVGVINIPEKRGLFTTTFTDYLMIVAVIFVVFVAAFAVFKSGWFGLDRLMSGPKGRPESEPEGFKAALPKT